MAIRDEILEFSRRGRLPSEQNDSEQSDEEFEETERLLNAIESPVTDDEAQLLLLSFGDDNCFGLSWTLLHLVESAPSPPVATEPSEGANVWIDRLWRRYRNTLAE